VTTAAEHVSNLKSANDEGLQALSSRGQSAQSSNEGNSSDHENTQSGRAPAVDNGHRERRNAINSKRRVTIHTQKVVEYMYKEEDNHFRESIDERHTKSPQSLMAELKKHIFYSLVVLRYNGDTNAIQAWFQEYWDEIGDNYDSDEDDDE
jgi:hypothetical protein